MHLVRLLLSCSLLALGAACADARTCPAPDAGDLGDCQAYQPAVVAGTESGTWASATDEQLIAVEVGDRGGGLVEVRLEASVPTEVNVRLAGRPVDELHAGVAVRVSDDVASRRFVFRAQGQKRYQLEVRPVGTPTGPASWTVSWSYQPNVDCYEPNDTLATAKRLPLDVPVQAFAHAGIIEGDGVLVGPGLLDYYRFELAEPTTVRLVATRPSDTAIAFELWNGATDASWLVGTDLFAPAGEASSSGDLELPAGTHYVRVSSFASQPSTQELTSPVPADWNQPYTLLVKRAAVGGAASGEAPLACATPVTAPANDDECVRYTPASVSGTSSFSLGASGATQVVPVAPIADPGGGLLRVTLTASHAAEVRVRRVGAPSGEDHDGVTVRVSDDVATRSFLFRAQGQERYELVATALIDPSPGAAALTVGWVYEPNVDCYEQNDTPAQARRIPLDRPITAFAHGGVIAGDGLLVGPSFADHYRFVLPEPRRVSLSVRKPSATAYTFELWSEADGVLASTDMLAAGGVDSTSGEVELPAGVHLVRVQSFASQPSSLATSETIPADWTQPYTLTVKTR